tara:strand:- start:20286 stop:21557 length:1272 start_codon:yes stop_codon:yes gene_type:complete
MSNKLNPFEEQLKKAAESHQVPYDSTQWDKLEAKLDGQSPIFGSFAKWSIAAAVALISVAIYYSTDGEGAKSEVIPDTNTEILAKESNNAIGFEKTTQQNESKDKEIEATVNTAPKVVEEITTQEANEVDNAIEDSKSDKNPDNVNRALVAKTDNKSVKSVTKSKVDPAGFVAPEVNCSTDRICAGVEFSAHLSNHIPTEVIWEINQEESKNGDELIHVFLQSGLYEIRAYFPEFKVYSETKELIVNPKPDASFTTKDVIENGMIPVVKFMPNSTGEKSYSWSYGDGTIGKSELGTHTYLKKREYPVSLQVVNKYGCTWDSHNRVIIDQDFDLLAPNAFSPNGDGENDTWIPIALTKNYFAFELKVFDRTGNLVFETSNDEVQFEGKVNGTLAPSGDAFVWKAFTVDPNGLSQVYSGVVMLYY